MPRGCAAERRRRRPVPWPARSRSSRAFVRCSSPSPAPADRLLAALAGAVAAGPDPAAAWPAGGGEVVAWPVLAVAAGMPRVRAQRQRGRPTAGAGGERWVVVRVVALHQVLAAGRPAGAAFPLACVSASSSVGKIRKCAIHSRQLEDPEDRSRLADDREPRAEVRAAIDAHEYAEGGRVHERAHEGPRRGGCALPRAQSINIHFRRGAVVRSSSPSTEITPVRNIQLSSADAEHCRLGTAGSVSSARMAIPHLSGCVTGTRVRPNRGRSPRYNFSIGSVASKLEPRFHENRNKRPANGRKQRN